MSSRDRSYDEAIQLTFDKTVRDCFASLRFARNDIKTMGQLFTNIKVLIWDFDGTFYKPNPELFAAVRQAEYKTIMMHTGWTYDETVEKFAESYRKVTPSATETVGLLTGMSTTEAALEMENYYDRRKFLGRDEKLISLMQKLGNFRHFILANGVRRRLEETLVVLGLNKNIFEEIVTSEVTGVNKPHEAGFKYILGKTRLPAATHLMIGDREQVDIIPAKKLGMKTCLVWSDANSEVADMTLTSVYEVRKILL